MVDGSGLLLACLLAADGSAAVAVEIHREDGELHQRIKRNQVGKMWQAVI